MGIIEVLVAAGLLAVVTVGISSLVVNMQTEQKRVQIKSSINDIKNRYNSLIVDNKAWTQTLSLNPAMLCLSSPGGCASTTPQVLNLYVPGSPPTLFRSISGASIQGFTESGTACDGFLAPPGDYSDPVNGHTLGTGNPRCPIAYSLLWEPVVAGQQNSMVKITGRLVYNSDASNNFQRSVETSYRLSTATWPLYTTTLPLARYDLQITRNSTSVGRQFTVAHDGLPGGHVPAASGGVCNTNTPRPLNVKDDGSSLITDPTATSTFTFNEAGLYKCSVTAVAFSVNAFQASVTRNGAAFATGNGFAGRWSQVSSNFDTSITILEDQKTSGASPAVFGMTQTCQTLPSVGPPLAVASEAGLGFNIDNFGLGMPTQPYGTPRYASITCVKVDD